LWACCTLCRGSTVRLLLRCGQLVYRRDCLEAKRATLLHMRRARLTCALTCDSLQVDVPGETTPGVTAAESSPSAASALLASRRVNEALLHRAATGAPFSVWKYAMTLDGKIATRSGHSAWVSGTCMHALHRFDTGARLNARMTYHCRAFRPSACVRGTRTLGRHHRRRQYASTRQPASHHPSRGRPRSDADCRFPLARSAGGA